MAQNRAQQVVQEQVLIRPERYAGYHKDLIMILNDSLRSASEGTSPARRRRELAEAVRAKASQMPAIGDAE